MPMRDFESIPKATDSATSHFNPLEAWIAIYGAYIHQCRTDPLLLRKLGLSHVELGTCNRGSQPMTTVRLLLYL